MPEGTDGLGLMMEGSPSASSMATAPGTESGFNSPERGYGGGGIEAAAAVEGGSSSSGGGGFGGGVEQQEPGPAAVGANGGGASSSAAASNGGREAGANTANAAPEQPPPLPPPPPQQQQQQEAANGAATHNGTTANAAASEEQQQEAGIGIEEVEVAICGMGFAGICIALKLREAGFGPIAGFEKAATVGGTWAANTYPGCACDVPSHLYSLSFEPSCEWSRMYPTQPEILAYLEGIAKRRHLLPVEAEEPEQEGTTRRRHRRPSFDPAKCYGPKQGGKAIVRLNTEVVEARWEEGLRKWVVRTKNWATGVTATVHARFFLTCILGLAIPVYPVIEGIENFTGAAFHTARWDHSQSLKGKRVAVIGTGASAVQVVPAIVDECAHLTLFQRTPPYVMRKNDWAFPATLRLLLKRLPLLRRALRLYLFWAHEAFAPAFLKPRESFLAWAATVYALAHLAWQTRGNADLRRRLTPNYQIGCKRALVSNDYYPALQRPNCTVVTAGVSEIRPLGWQQDNDATSSPPHPSHSHNSSKPKFTYPRPPSPPPPNGNMGNSDDALKYERRWAAVEGNGGGGVVVDEEGNAHEVDVIIYATGFKVKDAMEQVRVVGRDGMVLHEKFREQGWSSYLGVSVAGMPNFCMTMGSNTAVGHNSVLLLMEGQASYIVSLLTQMKRTASGVFCLKPQVEANFMAEMRVRLESTVWQAGGCRSWYLTSKGGTTTDMLWPGYTMEYVRRTRRARLRLDYDVWDRYGRPLPGNAAPALAPATGPAKEQEAAEAAAAAAKGTGGSIASTEQQLPPPRWENEGEGWLAWAWGKLPIVFL